MPTGVIARVPRLTFVDINNDPLSGGLVETYTAGTTTPATTWQDRELTAANTNPIVLDGKGGASVWLQDGLFYKMVVRDRFEVLQLTLDNISGTGADTSVELGAAAIQAALTQTQGYLAAVQALVAGGSGSVVHRATLDYATSNTAVIPGLNAVLAVHFDSIFVGDTTAYTVNPAAGGLPGTVIFPIGMAGVRKIYIDWI